MRAVLVKRRDLITIFRHFEKAYQIWGEIIDILEPQLLDEEWEMHEEACGHLIEVAERIGRYIKEINRISLNPPLEY